MAIAVQAYYDGSAGSAGQRHSITLAGYAGTPEFWAYFGERWRSALAGDGHRPRAAYLHMREAKALVGEFSPERGWTRKGVDALLADAVRCLTVGWGEFRDRVVGVACTVWLEDYARARLELVSLQEKTPAALCVDCCVTPALQMLPQAPKDQGILGKLGSLEVCFDRNEPFHHKIRRLWDRSFSKRPKPLQLVQHVGQADMRAVPALQAADYLAWHTNRHLAQSDLVAGVTRVLSAPMFGMEYDYATLIEQFSEQA